MNQSNEINKLAEALSKVQAEIKDAKLDSSNPHFKSKFASLESVYAATRTVLAKHGLSFTHVVEPWQDAITVSTVLMHSSGQWMKSVMPVRLDTSKPQAIGSAISYGKRYTLAAMVGITDTEDDDGNAAQESSKAGDYPISKDEVKVLELLINGDAELKKLLSEINTANGYKNSLQIQEKNYKRYLKAIVDYKTKPKGEKDETGN